MQLERLAVGDESRDVSAGGRQLILGSITSVRGPAVSGHALFWGEHDPIGKLSLAVWSARHHEFERSRIFRGFGQLGEGGLERASAQVTAPVAAEPRKYECVRVDATGGCFAEFLRSD